MNPGTPIPIYTVHDLELDLGKVEFAIVRIEAMSTPVIRNALVAHRCDFYQILWITQGQGKMWLDLDSFPVKPGTMCFASPGQIRAYEPQGPVAGFVIGFTQAFFSDAPDDANALIQLPYFYGVGSPPVLYADQEQADLFTLVCRRLEREIQLTLDGQSALLHSYMRILLIEARRIHQARPAAIRTEETGFLLTKRFVLLLEEHYLTNSSVADYAAMLYVTANHLIETTKRVMGRPAGKIIHDRLLLEAKRLLRYSDLPVTEIADTLNFEDPSYFSRYFKKYIGLSPSEFREQP